MDRVIGGEKDWFRVTLGNTITLVGMVIGFASVFFTLRADVAQVKNDLTDLKLTLKIIQDSQGDTRMNLKDLADKITDHSERIDRIDRHLESSDAQRQILENAVKVLDTNQQLMNQQLQYIGTSHLIQPSLKK